MTHWIYYIAPRPVRALAWAIRAVRILPRRDVFYGIAGGRRWVLRPSINREMLRLAWSIMTTKEE